MVLRQLTSQGWEKKREEQALKNESELGTGVAGRNLEGRGHLLGDFRALSPCQHSAKPDKEKVLSKEFCDLIKVTELGSDGVLL